MLKEMRPGIVTEISAALALFPKRPSGVSVVKTRLGGGNEGLKGYRRKALTGEKRQRA